MDKGDIWLPQKLDPMLGNIPGAFNDRGQLTPGHILAILVTRKVPASKFGVPGNEFCLISHITRKYR